MTYMTDPEFLAVTVQRQARLVRRGRLLRSLRVLNADRAELLRLNDEILGRLVARVSEKELAAAGTFLRKLRSVRR